MEWLLSSGEILMLGLGLLVAGLVLRDKGELHKYFVLMGIVFIVTAFFA